MNLLSDTGTISLERTMDIILKEVVISWIIFTYFQLLIGECFKRNEHVGYVLTLKRSIQYRLFS